MENNEHFSLRWNDFETNVSQAFQSLREEKDFFDVTLACEDNQIQAHKLILSACSPFFRNILRKNPHQHPLLYLKGVKYSEISSILNFMYHGEVNVSQNDLNAFLSVAEDLKVKGLTQDSNKKSEGSREQPKITNSDLKSNFPPPAKRSRTEQTDQTPKRERDLEIEEVVISHPVKTEPETNVVAMSDDLVAEEDYDQSYDYTEFESEVQYDNGSQVGARGEGNKEHVRTESMKDTGRNPEDLIYFEHDPTPLSKKNWRCKLCGEYFHNRGNAMNHVECKHLDVNYDCRECGKSFKSRNSWKTHRSVYHSQGGQQQAFSSSYQNPTQYNSI